MAKPRLVIHIGAAKSGSSAIQASLVKAHQSLKGKGYLVPDSKLEPNVPDTGHQIWFFQQCLRDKESASGSILRRLQRCKKAMETSDCHTLIVSAENLINAPDFVELITPAKNLFDLEIVAYLRRQDEYIRSAWQQWYFKRNRSFEDWLEANMASLGNWYEAIKNWDDAGCVSKITVRVFEREKLYKNDVSMDFFNIIGLDSEELGVESADYNRSLSETVLQIGERNRHLFNSLHDNRFHTFIAQYGGTKAFERTSQSMHLSREMRLRIIEVHREANEKLGREFMGIEESPFNEDYIPERLERDTTEQIFEELDLLWNILYKLYQNRSSGDS